MEFTDLTTMGKAVDAMDRISALPTFINHHIMSYLSAEEVIQTRILSKRWNHLQKTFPILDFDQSYFAGTCVYDGNFPDLRNDQGFRERLEKFTEFVDAFLHRFFQFKLCLQKFRLLISLLDVQKSSSVLDKWIGMAVESELKEFEIEVVSDTKASYSLPQTIFSSKFLTTLKLRSCKLECPSDSIRFHSLKKLTLSSVSIDEETVQKLTCECPLLEDLCFDFCPGLKHLCVSKAPKLKIMKIYAAEDELESFEIVLPSLEELDLLFSLEQTPQAIDFDCPRLKKLKFGGINLTDQKYLHLISKSPSLEDLTLSGCSFLEKATISSIQLKKLEVSYSYDLKALNLDTPNLLSFTYDDRNSFLTSSIKAPCPLVVRFNPQYIFSTQWCLKLREFLGLINQIEALNISVVCNIGSFNLDEFRESCLSLPCTVGNLDLPVGHLPWSDYRILLEGFLWICYPRTLSVRTQSCSLKDQNETLKLLYDQLNDRDVKFCNFNHIKCWRHYLKDVKIESFERFEDKKLYDLNNLMKLLNADNLKEVWPNLPEGILRFHLDWCFPLPLDEA